MIFTQRNGISTSSRIETRNRFALSSCTKTRRSETLSLASPLASVWAENTPVIRNSRAPRVSPRYLYLVVTPRFSFLRPPRPRFAYTIGVHCRVWISFCYFFEMFPPTLHSAQKTCRSTIFHKMTIKIKTGGRRGGRRRRRRRVERMKLYSNDALPSLPTHFSDRPRRAI